MTNIDYSDSGTMTELEDIMGVDASVTTAAMDVDAPVSDAGAETVLVANDTSLISAGLLMDNTANDED